MGWAGVTSNAGGDHLLLWIMLYTKIPAHVLIVLIFKHIMYKHVNANQ
jgi:hypothetical protein